MSWNFKNELGKTGFAAQNKLYRAYRISNNTYIQAQIKTPLLQKKTFW